MEILFRHFDPAGIVFYPRYFEMINDFIEEWFDKSLGVSFHTLHTERGIGTPTAAVQCDFKLPSRWHERLRQVLELQHIGGSSFLAQVRFEGQDGKMRLSAQVTIVTVDLARMRATALPDDLRAAMQEFLSPAQA
ncbi:thioesterase superfamily [Bordetella holmesii 70147]|nr:thioesterase superfamily [Bordetella holmesii 70147]